MFFIRNSVDVSVEKDKVIVKGFLGRRFKHECKTFFGNEKKFNAVISKYSYTQLEFYTFFLPEMIYFLTTLLGSKKTFGCDLVLINNLVTKLSELKFDSNYTGIDYELINKVMDMRILPHQQPIFDRYETFKKDLHYRGILLDAEPGTGKTFSSLALSVGVHSNFVIIICPLPTVNKVWTTSLAGGPGSCVFKEPVKYFSMSENREYNNEKYMIVHYEAIEKFYEIAIKHPEFRGATIIIDESHNLADSKSKRTVACLNLVDLVESDNVFALSGTPLKSSYAEISTLFNFIYKNYNKVIEDRYLKLYKNPNENMSKFLQTRYQGISIKVKKESIGLDPVINNELVIKLKNGNQYTLEHIRGEIVEFCTRRKRELEEQEPYWTERYFTLYNKVKDMGVLPDSSFSKYEKNIVRLKSASRGDLFYMTDLLAEVNSFENSISKHLHGEDKKEWKEAKTIYKYPALKIQGEALGLVVMGARIRCHKDLAANINYKDIVNSTTKKTLVFSSYIEVCNEAYKKCRSEGYIPLEVYGNNTKNLTATVDDFTINKKLNPLIASYKSLGTGVPVLAANVVICLDLPFRLYMYDQAISRVWRLGQDQQVQVYIVKLDTEDKPNINGRNIDIMEYFKKEIEEITGFKSNIDISVNKTEDNTDDEDDDYEYLATGAIDNYSIKSFFKFSNINDEVSNEGLVDRFELFLNW